MYVFKLLKFLNVSAIFGPLMAILDFQRVSFGGFECLYQKVPSEKCFVVLKNLWYNQPQVQEGGFYIFLLKSFPPLTYKMAILNQQWPFWV